MSDISIKELMKYKTRAGKAELKVTRLSKAETRLRGLLERCELFINVCGVDVAHTIGQLDPTLMDELAKELRDDQHLQEDS